MRGLAPNSKMPTLLVQDLRQLIADAQRQAAAAVNMALTLLYWRVGDRIRREVLGNQRAGYGEDIYATLSRELAVEFGRWFETTKLHDAIAGARKLFESNEPGVYPS